MFSQHAHKIGIETEYKCARDAKTNGYGCIQGKADSYSPVNDSFSRCLLIFVVSQVMGSFTYRSPI